MQFDIDRRKNSFKDPYVAVDIAQITCVSNPEKKGRLCISLAPGKKDHKWNRDLQLDLNDIKKSGIQIIICLLEWSEMMILDIIDYPKRAQENGFIFYLFPIKDRNVPQKKELDVLIPVIIQHLSVGDNVLVHCRGGLGRAGTICACCLGHFGYDGYGAINLVRQRRSGAIQTEKQEQCVRDYCQGLVKI